MSTAGGTTETGTRDHVISRLSGAVLEALDRVVDGAAWAMTTEEQATALVELDRVLSRVSELRLRVLAAADGGEIGAATGTSSTASWLAVATRQTRAAAASDVRLAGALDQRFPAVREAMARGAVNTEQARVIVSALDQLRSEEVAPEDLDRAEAHLVEQAARFDAKALRVLGRRLFEVIAPDRADEREGKKLEEEERKARRATYLNLRDNGDGTHSGSFKISDLHAAMLRKALSALIAPRRIGPERLDPVTGRKRPYPELLGQAFSELLERYPAEALPVAGGTNATVVVTIDLDFLLSGLGAATLDDGTRISASEARRLACEARIIPMVLGGDSVPLDVGRARRFHSPYQRLALAQRDGGCQAEGCDRPPSWCEAHHEIPWAAGGPTDLRHGGLRCFHHHRLEHDPSYDKARLPDGSVRYHRRT